MAATTVNALLFTAFFSRLMQLSMAQDKPAAARARVVDATAIDQAIAYLLMFAALFVTYFAHSSDASCLVHNNSIEQSRAGAATMAAVKVYVLLFTALFFSGLMQLSMAQDKPATATARVVDATAIDQAIAYLLMFAALFVTYFAH
ncbi:hypothetical protein EJB05_15727, partial [Eragrostis curvula]